MADAAKLTIEIEDAGGAKGSPPPASSPTSTPPPAAAGSGGSPAGTPTRDEVLADLAALFGRGPAGSPPPAAPAGGAPAAAAGAPPASVMVDVRKEMERHGWDGEKAGAELADRVTAHLAAGGKVTHWLDDAATPVESAAGRYVRGPGGRVFDTSDLTLGQPGMKTGLEFHPPPGAAAAGYAGSVPPPLPPPAGATAGAGAGDAGVPAGAAADGGHAGDAAGDAAGGFAHALAEAGDAAGRFAEAADHAAGRTKAAGDAAAAGGPGRGGGAAGAASRSAARAARGKARARAKVKKRRIDRLRFRATGGYTARGFAGLGALALGLGHAAQGAAQNRAMPALDVAAGAAAGGLMMLGPAGVAAAAGVGALTAAVHAAAGAVNAFAERGKELSGYNGQIASAAALADIRSILTDIREANELGEQYSRMIENQSKLNAIVQETLMPIKGFLMDVLNTALELLMEGVAGVLDVCNDILQVLTLGFGRSDKIDDIVKKIHDILAGPPGGGDPLMAMMFDATMRMKGPLGDALAKRRPAPAAGPLDVPIVVGGP